METTDHPAVAGPTIKRGRSKQDHPTPPEFIRAVEQKFGKLDIDLAANKENAKAPRFISEEQNSLTTNWAQLGGLLWLNPPFAHIEPWAAKCRMAAENGARILLLTPASVGSVWFGSHILGRAMVFSLFPRISFDGIAPYPKDCMLSVFWGGVCGFDMWKWK
jgi:phage N-6-adenine-methyltransferase